MYSPKGGGGLWTSTSRPRVIPLAVAPPVPLHVTSTRKVHRSADGIINIIQEISFYAEGGFKSHAGAQLREVHSAPDAQVRANFSAETNARVFVGERLIRMLIQTAIRPDAADALEFNELFHFAESSEAAVIPIAFEATLEHVQGENPAVEFDLSSPIVVCLKQRIRKSAREHFQVLQAIELRANESEGRPTQELVRKSTLTQPTNESAQFRERIFTGTDVARVDRDITFVVDRPNLSLSERREYIPSYPTAPRRRSASLTRAPRLSHTPTKPAARSRSQSRSSTTPSATTSEINCPTAVEDFRTACSPYSLRSQETTESPFARSPHLSDRTARSTRKKWTVNSGAAKAGGTPSKEKRERARTARSLSTARNRSLSPQPAPAQQPQNGETAYTPAVSVLPPSELGPHGEGMYPSAQQHQPQNGEIGLAPAVTIPVPTELGPHGECLLVEGMEVLKVVHPVDSLIATGVSRSDSNCSTAAELRSNSQLSNENYKACHTAPYSPVRSMPREKSQSSSSRESNMYTAREAELEQAAALDKRRRLFGYGTRPTTTPTRSTAAPLTPSLMHSPVAAPPLTPLFTGMEASPMRTAQRMVISPVQTAVHLIKSSSKRSKKSKSSSKSERKTLCPYDQFLAKTAASSVRTAVSPALPSRNLFGTENTGETVAAAFLAPREKTAKSQRSSHAEKSKKSRRSTKSQRSHSKKSKGSHSSSGTAQSVGRSHSVTTAHLPSPSATPPPSQAKNRSLYLSPAMAPLNREETDGAYRQVVTARVVTPAKDSTPLRSTATARDRTSTMRTPLRTPKTARQLSEVTPSRPAAAAVPQQGAYAPPKTTTTARSAHSKSPASRLARFQPGTQHHTMADADLRQEDGFADSPQCSYRKTASGGFAPTSSHSANLRTGLERTPLKTESPSLYYSTRQTTPSHTAAAKQSPMRAPYAGIEARSPLVQTAALRSPHHQPSNLASSTRPCTPSLAPIADMRTYREPAPPLSHASPFKSPAPSSRLRTAVGSPDAVSNSDNSNEDVKTGWQLVGDASPRRRGPSAPAAPAAPVAAATNQPAVCVKTRQADGKIYVEVTLSLALNTTGAIRVRGEMAKQLTPRAATFNGQQIWSAPFIQ